MKRLLIVGSGMTSASLSFLLSRVLNPQLVELTVWDKARGTGGRMSTSRSNTIPECHTDLGAQYFSCTPEYAEKHREFYDLLLKEKVLVPLTSTIENEREYPTGTKHYVSPLGSASIPKTLLNHSGLKVQFGHHVSSIDMSQNSKTWSVSCADGTQMNADVLVLTLPVPQILALKGDFHQYINEDTTKKLHQVQYSSRFALGLFYQPGTELPGDWTAMYVSNNPCVRFVSKDHQKRGRHEDPPVVTVHTSVPFGLEMQDTARPKVEERIMKELRSVFPGFPDPVETKLTFWRFSQVHKEFDSRPGCVLVHPQPPLILAGDGFCHSNINGAISSAKAAMTTMEPIISRL